MIEQSRKDRLVKKVRERMQEWYATLSPDERGPIGAYCMYWAIYTCQVLREDGIKAQIQAGSAYWRRVRDEQDDGVSPNRFGYEFGDDKRALINAIMSGRLPEMHVWAAVAGEEPQIIDLTTCFWPEQARMLNGFDWPGDLPPDYLWVTPDQWPANAHYRPNPQAISYVYQMMRAMQSGGDSAVIVLKV